MVITKLTARRSYEKAQRVRRKKKNLSLQNKTNPTTNKPYF